MANSRQSRIPPTAHPEVTKEQLVVLRAFRKYFDANKIAPSLAELATTLSIAVPTVSVYLTRLTRNGCLQKTRARYRSWLLTDLGLRLTERKVRASVETAEEIQRAS